MSAVLGAARVPHAVGGAIALAHYGVARPTADIDVNVFVPAERWPEVREALRPIGVGVDVEAAALERDGEVRLPWESGPVHLFFSCDELHKAMAGAVRRVPFGKAAVPIVRAEHLLIRKAMHGRSKDWVDVEQMLATTELDMSEVEAWLGRLAGDSDPRLTRLQGIAAGVLPDR